jgi:hypothetical protein
MRTPLAWLLAIVGTVAACGSPSDDDGGEPTPEPGDTLVVMPSLARLEVINGAPAEQAFTVSLVKLSGEQFDVTSRVTWTLGDPLIGSFAGPLFTARGGSAGVSPVHATLDTVQGAASIEVFVRNIRVGPGAPGNAPDLFAVGTEDPGTAPVIAYPPPQVIVPRNLGDLEMHWRDGFGHDLYELSMVNDHVDLKLYVGSAGPTGWSQFSTAEWYAASMGGSEIQLKLRAITTATPQVIGTAAPQELLLTNDDLEGGLYYWASTSGGGAYGIFRHDFGNPGQPAEPFYTNVDAGRCVACHALSRDGEHMAVVWDGGDGPATMMAVGSQTTVPDAMAWNFASYSPDSARLITSRGGTLTVRDGTTGAVTGTVPTAGFATHPDFSPQGNLLAFTRASAAAGANDWHFAGGEIVTVSFDPATGAWGTATPIVSGGGFNNYYPSVSPDGEWVLFNRSNEDAYDDASAELWVAKIDGTGARKLDLANVQTGLTNSWARWAPFRSNFGPAGASEDLFWITWSSKRDFGVRLVGVNQPQIWMSPFFPDRIAAGNDPTAPAFRLPFQDIASNNHIAQWTEVVVPIGKMQIAGIKAEPGQAAAAQRPRQPSPRP